MRWTILILVGSSFLYNQKTEGISLAVRSQKNVLKSLQIFTLKLNKILFAKAQQEGNVIFSPISLYVSLAMTHLGTNKETQSEIADFLRIPSGERSSKCYHEALCELLHMILNNTSSRSSKKKFKYEINIGQGIFTAPSVHRLRSLFRSEVKSLYNATTKIVNFEENAKNATETINNFIVDSTKERIHYAYLHALNNFTRMIFASTSFLKATWIKRFQTSLTRPEKFYMSRSVTEQHQTMHFRKKILYGKFQKLQVEVVKLLFEGRELAMTIILPYPTVSLDTILQRINETKFFELFDTELEGRFTDFKIPRLRLIWVEDISRILFNSGITRIFTMEAQTKKMTNSLIDLTSVSGFLHACELHIDEHGIHSDIVIEKTKELIKDHGKMNYFYVNRGFLFFIKHIPTDIILHFGTITNPFNTKFLQ